MTCRYCFLSKGVRKNACCYCASLQTVDLNAPHGVWTNVACSECAAIYEAGRDAMARTYWAAVCERLAKEADAVAAERQRYAAMRRGYVTGRSGAYDLDWMTRAAGKPQPGVNDRARMTWNQGQTLLSDLSSLYAEAREAADVGRRLRAWAKEGA